MFRYAQIDENGRVFTTSEHSAELKHERAIPIPSGFDPWDKRWNGTDWEDCEPEPEPVIPLSEQEQIVIDTALNVEYIACLMEANLQ